MIKRQFMLIAAVLLGLCAAGVRGRLPRRVRAVRRWPPSAPAEYGEAPMLAALVAAGELPPVDERLPVNPSVRTPIEEVGTYGGTVRVFALDNWPWQDMTESVERGPYMLTGVDGKLLPDVAESVQMAADNTSVTITLREGHKWSDGHPVSSDDVVFQFMSMHNHPEVVTYKKSPFVTNAIAVDAQTVRLEFDSPHPEMLVKLATWHGGDWEMLKPKHYLKKWHIDFNDKANEVAKEEGHETWQQAFTDHFFWKPSTDLDLPVIQGVALHRDHPHRAGVRAQPLLPARRHRRQPAPVHRPRRFHGGREGGVQPQDHRR